MTSQRFLPTLMLLFICLCGKVCCRDSQSLSNPFIHLPGIQLAALSTQNKLSSDSKGGSRSSGKQVYLRLTSEMKNQSANSGERVSFKCKVEGSEKHKITYTWYKDNRVINSEETRISITTRPWGSRLKISGVFTVDAGKYRCEASNSWRRVQTQAYLNVQFARPPKFDIEDGNPPLSSFFPSGKCEKYKGFVCDDFLKGVDVYVHAFGTQKDMNREITSALRKLTQPMVSQQCRRYLLPAFCHFAFPTCQKSEEGVSRSGARLCREDCEILKSDTCRREFDRDNEFVRELFDTANCSLLSSYKDDETCVRIGLTSSATSKDQDEGCDKNGGAVSVTISGKTCKSWPLQMGAKRPELLGGHNFCRSSETENDLPWCFVNEERTDKENCVVKPCVSDDNDSTKIIFIAIPSACAVLLLALCCVIYCKCRRNKHPTNMTEKTIPAKAQTTLIKREVKVPEVNSSCIQLLMEIGSSEFGKAYKGQIVNDSRFPNGFPVVVKTLDDVTMLENFMSEIEVLSELHHPNIMCLKAVSLQSNFRCLIFENPEVVDLHQHLMARSPNCDITSTATMVVVPQFDLADIAAQVVSGLEYLSSHGFCHRDVAARNVSLCSDHTVKINLHGITRDAYASNYYKPAANAVCFPIRWMSPESVRAWQFLDKCDVYSFGVLLWEMYSYASQPYCGYNNREVLEMISRRQLLTCPDQCPAKVYSLMHECWFAQPSQRPSFKEILVKMSTWSNSDDSVINMDQIHMASDVNSIISSVPPPDYSSIAPWNASTAASERSFASAPRRNPASSRDDHSRYYDNRIACASQVTEVTSLISASRDSGLPADDLQSRYDRNRDFPLLRKPSNHDDGNMTT
uniref:Tyrosine-protein kinase transmembrane receptor ROR2 n=1 Tax=Phallusia mammillata TaxID=59560 RepID=A0A6F9DRQ0_9ASCI|nr:tyrosine-protein kinase transmembrane receptor ROR2 [Phallusia mammillata]